MVNLSCLCVSVCGQKTQRSTQPRPDEIKMRKDKSEENYIIPEHSKCLFALAIKSTKKSIKINPIQIARLHSINPAKAKKGKQAEQEKNRNEIKIKIK